MKKYFVIIIISLFVGKIHAQEKVGNKINEVKIQTSAICESCKKRIEKELNYTKGVIFAELDLETKIVIVRFKTKHITADEIRQLIANLGYNADNVKRKEEAYSNLPKCCKVEGECKE